MGERARKRETRALSPLPAAEPPDLPARAPEARPHPGEPRFPAVRMHAGFEAFRGPIPRPELLREYDQVLPGLAERIVAWTEKEADHRRAVERSLVRLSWGGLWSGLLVAFTTITGGMLLAWNGRSVAGVVGVVGALAGLVIVFLAGRRGGAPEAVEAA